MTEAYTPLDDQDMPEGEDWIDPPNQNGAHDTSSGRDDFATIFDGPDLSAFIHEPKTATAREYEKRTRAIIKAGILNAINQENLADAATLIYYGKSFCAAAGELANADTKARKLIDAVSSPSNPYVMFGLASIPMVAQLFRNHEEEVKKYPGMRRRFRAARKAEKEKLNQQPPSPPLFTLRFLGKEIPVRLRTRRNPLRRFFENIRSQTHEPNALVVEVFTNKKLVSELQKQGINIRVRSR